MYVRSYVPMESIGGGKPVGCYEGRRTSGVAADAQGMCASSEASGRFGTAAKGRFNATSTLSSLHLRLRNGPTYLALLPPRVHPLRRSLLAPFSPPLAFTLTFRPIPTDRACTLVRPWLNKLRRSVSLSLALP